jgi:hypothetical protein
LCGCLGPFSAKNAQYQTPGIVDDANKAPVQGVV